MPIGMGVFTSCQGGGSGSGNTGSDDVTIIRVSFASKGYTTIHFTVTYNYTTHQTKVTSYSTGETRTGGVWHQQEHYGQADGVIGIAQVEGYWETFYGGRRAYTYRIEHERNTGRVNVRDVDDRRSH
ncbi:hypothetical protein [Tunicatimonas pelagia]|uniref:hypothetical protein n=1 Tax=Tunicatimonas pelagia TaxID=931531 RepID=UPI0026659D8D|nr:hypothetical protein [Tunicatimonas pelagia]WKN41871.1 hypothetical protein P0M28_22790 [Tunicatimonas pelagia]